MKLIDNWHQFWRLASVHGMVLMTAWGMTPQADQQALMVWVFGTAAAAPYVMPALGFLTLYLRLVKQGGEPKP